MRNPFNLMAVPLYIVVSLPCVADEASLMEENRALREEVARLRTENAELRREIAQAPDGSAKQEARLAEAKAEDWSLHAQTAVITQDHPPFDAKYTGQNSLQTREEEKTSVTSTLFVGRRLWEGGEVYVDGELAGGKGFSHVTGIAGFPNGEIPRVGAPDPTPYIARAFLRQNLALGDDEVTVDTGQNVLAGPQKVSRLTLTFGKLSASDVFDQNRYSHDPRAQFMNWSIMDDAAWDYPADVRGYTWGGVVELDQPTWALRYGAFLMPKHANGQEFVHDVGKANGQAFEAQKSYSLFGRPGEVTALAYLNTANMGSYREATELSPPDVTMARRRSTKYGFGLNVEQELTDDLGAFLRLGWNDGRNESYVFTEVDETASFGLSLKGTRWKRPDDVVGLAGAINGISDAHEDYLAAGGLGFLLGDGRLRYGTEGILETYYAFKLGSNIALTFDYQFIDNPAYNEDRGPAHVFTLRFHFDF